MTKVRGLLRTPWLGPLLALIVLYALFTALAPDTFARQSNLLTMLRQTAVVGIAAVGMTFTIVLGGIDLSVGSAVALTTVVVARACAPGWARLRPPRSVCSRVGCSACATAGWSPG